jgi:hypothetical protein
MNLDGVCAVGPNPEQYIRELACDALGVIEVDLTFVTFVTDDNGITIATGRVLAA